MGKKSSKVDLERIFERAEIVVSTSLKGRPRIDSEYVPKVNANIRLSAEVVDWLKSMGPQHFSRINGLLIALMEAEKEMHESKN